MLRIDEMQPGLPIQVACADSQLSDGKGAVKCVARCLQVC